MNTEGRYKKKGKEIKGLTLIYWLFDQVLTLLQRPMQFVQLLLLGLIAVGVGGIQMPMEMVYLLGGIVVLFMITIGYILYRKDFYTALRNWEYGAKDNEMWDHRSELACARTAYYIQKSPEELEKIIEREVKFLFKDWA